MSDRYFVDTNILMYAHDTAAGEKHARAKALVEALWENRAGVVSTEVLQELAVNLRRNAGKPLDAKAPRDVVSDYLTWRVVVNGGDSILEALDLEARYRVSFWDALVIEAAHAGGAEILYSEDLSDGSDTAWCGSRIRSRRWIPRQRRRRRAFRNDCSGCGRCRPRLRGRRRWRRRAP